MKFSESEIFLLHALVIGFDRMARESVLAPFETTYGEFLVLMAIEELTVAAAPSDDASRRDIRMPSNGRSATKSASPANYPSSEQHASPTHQEVEQYLDTSKSLVSQRVRVLVDRGLVSQTRGRENRREIRLSLTSEGGARVETIYNALLEASDGVFRSLGSGRERFRRNLAHLLDSLRSPSPDVVFGEEGRAKTGEGRGE